VLDRVANFQRIFKIRKIVENLRRRNSIVGTFPCVNPRDISGVKKEIGIAVAEILSRKIVEIFLAKFFDTAVDRARESVNFVNLGLRTQRLEHFPPKLIAGFCHFLESKFVEILEKNFHEISSSIFPIFSRAFSNLKISQLSRHFPQNLKLTQKHFPQFATFDDKTETFAVGRNKRGAIAVNPISH